MSEMGRRATHEVDGWDWGEVGDWIEVKKGQSLVGQFKTRNVVGIYEV